MKVTVLNLENDFEWQIIYIDEEQIQAGSWEWMRTLEHLHDRGVIELEYIVPEKDVAHKFYGGGYEVKYGAWNEIQRQHDLARAADLRAQAAALEARAAELEHDGG